MFLGDYKWTEYAASDLLLIPTPGDCKGRAATYCLEPEASSQECDLDRYGGSGGEEAIQLNAETIFASPEIHGGRGGRNGEFNKAKGRE